MKKIFCLIAYVWIVSFFFYMFPMDLSDIQWYVIPEGITVLFLFIGILSWGD